MSIVHWRQGPTDVIDDLPERMQIDGFDQMEIESRFVRSAPIFLQAVTADRYQNQWVHFVLGTEPWGDFVAIHARQTDI